MHQLSADILEEILSRLHVKDLLRFKSVSKTWNSIISSQYFINLHLKKSISSPSHCRIFPPYSVSLVYDDVQQVELTWPDEATGYFIGISSDGLVCYMDNISVHPTRICVWNPATRVSKTLNIDGMKFHLLVSWFGRESSDDVYKEGKLLHGIVHWLVTKISAADPNHAKVLMLTYNLGQKTVGELMPTPIKSHEMHHITGIGVIGVIDGCMSAIQGYCEGFYEIYEVWVMKEYGIKESWTKLFTIPHSCDNVQNLELVGVSGYGDIAFRSRTRHDNVAENIYTMNFFTNRRYIRMYVETLVSPKRLSRITAIAPTK
ncbi:hypothetical protein MIMGU_mgv1a021932mg, partial [Erythranthe guttata]